jgi:hypothetical protein
MRIRQSIAVFALGVAAIGLTGCANQINTTVSRYQAMPAPLGQTFFVVPAGGMANNGGLEFQHFAGMIAQQLQARGYQPASDARSASMVVQFAYGVDNGQVRVVDTGFYGSPFYTGWGWGGIHRSRWGWGGWGWGWDDPYWYGGGINSYVEYHGQIDVHIRAAGSNAPLFDGRAQARAETNRLDVIVPSLIEAMFTGFPGQNGETIKITIPTQRAQRS